MPRLFRILRPCALSPFPPAACVLLLCLAGEVRAQERDGVRITTAGLLQVEALYGRSADDARLGIGTRRVRLRVTAEVGPRAGLMLQGHADRGAARLLDGYVFYDVSPRVRLRAGRMVGAQPRAYNLTSGSAVDATERAAVALRWNAGTLGNKGRDFGVDARYRTEGVEASVFVHHGGGDYGDAIGNYRPNIAGDVTAGIDRSLADLAFSGYLAVEPAAVPGLEVGGFAGYNGSRAEATEADDTGRRYVSYAAHAYLGALPFSRPLRFKVDALGIAYAARSGGAAERAWGVSALAAAAVRPGVEAFGRVESFRPDGGAPDERYLTAGASFSPSLLRGASFSRERLTLAYSARLADDEPARHLLVLQAQVSF